MIRKASESDRKELECWLSSEKTVGFSWSQDQIKNEWKTNQVFVYFEGLDLLAFAIIKDLGGVQEIIALMSHPQKRRKGYAQSLLKSLLELEFADLEFWLEVHESNLGARNLYEKLGFAVVGKRPFYYPDGGTALLMTRKSS